MISPTAKLSQQVPP